MKDIKYVVTLVQGYDSMRFAFTSAEAASAFANTAIYNHEPYIDYNGNEKGFQVSIELGLEEGESGDEEPATDTE